MMPFWRLKNIALERILLLFGKDVLRSELTKPRRENYKEHVPTVQCLILMLLVSSILWRVVCIRWSTVYCQSKGNPPRWPFLQSTPAVALFSPRLHVLPVHFLQVFHLTLNKISFQMNSLFPHFHQNKTLWQW